MTDVSIEGKKLKLEFGLSLLDFRQEMAVTRCE
jgi:hypothetical protein